MTSFKEKRKEITIVCDKLQDLKKVLLLYQSSSLNVKPAASPLVAVREINFCFVAKFKRKPKMSWVVSHVSWLI